ncbi:MAG: transcriptional regulator [Phyllobacteriaceae bacterium]|nr:transcriptional regulator [Phyllobacteriaceae bacterium]
MPLTSYQAERERLAKETLLAQYRAIGPAAITAALLCAPKRDAQPLKKAA